MLPIMFWIQHCKCRVKGLAACAVFGVFECLWSLCMLLSVCTLNLKPRDQTDKVSVLAGGWCVL